ncbi:MAG: response regulator transcription factor [Desulfobacula sp.]|nr:response regulator transcription factor [Desulfobacula sp.]
MKTVAVVIADDHPLVISALRNAFQRNSKINLIGEANNGIELLELIKKRIPDIAIIDLEMPKMDGYETILELHTIHPEIKTIAFSGFLNSANQQRVIDLGAYASISKTETSKNIFKAFQAVMDGENYHSAITSNDYEETVEQKDDSILTLREKQIIKLIAQGKTSKQISEAYNISQWTVDKHRSNIKEKLGIKSLAEMIRYAIENA